MILFHLSTNLDHDGVFDPVIPDGITEGDSEDWETPRICFSSTIEGCLGSIPEGGRGLQHYCNDGWVKGIFKLFVLDTEKVPVQLMTPDSLLSLGKVKDAGIHQEYWVLNPIALKSDVLVRVENFISQGDEISRLHMNISKLQPLIPVTFTFNDVKQRQSFVLFAKRYEGLAIVVSTRRNSVTLTTTKQTDIGELFRYLRDGFPAIAQSMLQQRSFSHLVGNVTEGVHRDRDTD